ncbi:MAG TPA: BrnA antitoxin family protein [Caulobacteraceae bacterium]
MKTKLDSHNAETAPPLTDAQREHLAELAALPDESIDTSDIPELSDQTWNAGVRGRFYRPVKQQITARVDADVLDWLKSEGRGYQGRLNAILRREMLASLKQAKRA